MGAHPIAGKETSGVRESDPGLFSGKKCVVTPVESTCPEALSMVKTLFSLVGSEIVEMDPESHDEIFSLVSHLPHAVAYSLVSAVASLGGERNLLIFQAEAWPTLPGSLRAPPRCGPGFSSRTERLS